MGKMKKREIEKKWRTFIDCLNENYVNKRESCVDTSMSTM